MARHMNSDSSESYRIVLEYRWRERNPKWLYGVDQPGVPEFLEELSDVHKSVRGPFTTLRAARGQRSRQRRERCRVWSGNKVFPDGRSIF